MRYSPKDDYDVVVINREQAKQLITEYHYLGAKGFRFQRAYGLQRITTGELVGAAVFHSPSAPETVVGAFGLPRNEQSGIWELGRFVLASDCNGGNLGSYLLGAAIRQLRRDVQCDAIITYADNTLHYGALYQATNFKYCGLSSKKNDFWVRTEDGFRKQERGKTKGVDGEWRPRPQKHRYVMLFNKRLSLKWEIVPYIKEK